MEKKISYFVPIERVAAYFNTDITTIRKELYNLVYKLFTQKIEMVLLNNELMKHERKYSIENNSTPIKVVRATFKIEGNTYQGVIMMEFTSKQADQESMRSPIGVEDDR